MILPETELKERLESPMNLLNRLKTAINPHRGSANSTTHPALPPKAEDIIPDIDQKIGVGSVKNKAINIMTKAMTTLETRIEEVVKPEHLARIASEMGKVVSGLEQKEQGPNVGQIIIYAPQVMSERDFDTIDVSGTEQ